MVMVQEPNTAFCRGQDCGEWSWVSRDFALEEFIETHCPSAPGPGDIEGFAAIPVPSFPAY